METSLHRDLKLIYACDADCVEVTLGSYRIDAIDRQGQLVEVQHAGLGAIRDKVAQLTRQHPLRVIKPLLQQKRIDTLEVDGLKVARSRCSPKRESYLDLFPEMLHFTSAFPNKNLTLEVPLVKVVEIRAPQPNRYRRKKQYRVVDQVLIEIAEQRLFRDSHDLLSLLEIPRSHARKPFGTTEIAEWIGRPRWFAQQVTYVLSRCGAIEQVGKKGNAKQYRKVA